MNEVGFLGQEINTDSIIIYIVSQCKATAHIFWVWLHEKRLYLIRGHSQFLVHVPKNLNRPFPTSPFPEFTHRELFFFCFKHLILPERHRRNYG